MSRTVKLIGPLSSGSAAGGIYGGDSSSDYDNTVAVVGKLLGVYVQYNGSPPNTTDVIVSTKGVNAPSADLLNVANANTSKWFYPRVPIVKTDGSAISAQYAEIPISDFVNVAIDDADDGNSVSVWLLLE